MIVKVGVPSFNLRTLSRVELKPDFSHIAITDREDVMDPAKTIQTVGM
jgi:hypothetical protein